MNIWYAGKHWSLRNKTKDEWRLVVGGIVHQKKIPKIKKFPIEIQTKTKIKSKRTRDTSNCFTANKLVEDALVAAGVIPDDTTEFVSFHHVAPPEIGTGVNETIVILKGDS